MIGCKSNLATSNMYQYGNLTPGFIPEIRTSDSATTVRAFNPGTSLSQIVKFSTGGLTGSIVYILAPGVKLTAPPSPRAYASVGPVDS